ncbi:MAG: hypothetical protein EZS28_003283 [Streblomastix strix]|uniref:Uncharacterized protein n=1 Tax=Streblomastix strix TaxID=222440 RepID=A0A5J4X1Z0_9EUKA|nr:MAG: hypothetical protein EZS28_003283 [Streblomastix strix]
MNSSKSVTKAKQQTLGKSAPPKPKTKQQTVKDLKTQSKVQKQEESNKIQEVSQQKIVEQDQIQKDASPVPPAKASPLVKASPPQQAVQQITEDQQLEQINSTVPDFLQKIKSQQDQLKKQDSARVVILQQIVLKLDHNLELERTKRDSEFKKLRDVLQTLFGTTLSNSLKEYEERFKEISSVCDATQKRLKIIDTDLSIKDTRLEKIKAVFNKLQPVTSKIAIDLENNLRVAPLKENALLQQLLDRIRAMEEGWRDFLTRTQIELRRLEQEIAAFHRISQEEEDKLEIRLLTSTADIEERLDTECDACKDTLSSIVISIETLSRSVESAYLQRIQN